MGLFGCFCTSEIEWRFFVCKYAGLVYSVVAKITSEEVALEYGRRIGLDIVTINPALVLGPLLQPMCNTSCQFLIGFIKHSCPFLVREGFPGTAGMWFALPPPHPKSFLHGSKI
jgi:hypothetical protein